MDLPPGSHIIYIPAVILLGVIIGFILGGRAARDQYNLQLRREAERAEARAKREARKRERGAENRDNDGEEDDTSSSATP